MRDGVGRDLAVLEATGAHSGRGRQRDRRVVDSTDRLAGDPAVGGVADDGLRIGRGELQRERCGVKSAQVTEDRRRSDGRKSRARIRRTGCGGIAVHIRAEGVSGVHVECKLAGIRRRDRADHRAVGIHQADILARLAEFEVGVQVGRAIGWPDVEPGGHYNQIAAGRDAAAGREIPFARLVGIVGQRPAGQVDRLAAGVVQLNPVALRIRRVLLDIGLVLLIAGRSLRLACTDKETAKVCGARQRARGRAGRFKRGASDQIGAGQAVVMDLQGEHIVAAGQQSVGGTESHHLYSAAILAGTVTGAGKLRVGGDRVDDAHIPPGDLAAVEIDNDGVVVVEREPERLAGGGLSRCSGEQSTNIERGRNAVHLAQQVCAEHQTA